MEENETTKPKSGAWDQMDTAIERKPQIKWEKIGESHTVTFPTHFEKPLELGNDKDGVYYLFGCSEAGEDKVFLTSAWSMLRGLKAFMPLAGKTLKITKEIKSGKQNYLVEEVDVSNTPVDDANAKPEVEVVKPAA